MYDSYYSSQMGYSNVPAPLQIKIAIRRQLPKTLEDLYSQKLEYVNKAVKAREDKNWGRRMVSWTSNYSWEATPWDWTLDELKYIAADTHDIRKWKRAAAYKLAKETQAAVPKLMEEWRYKESSTRLVALKTSVIVKKAFYEQYTSLKKVKDENGTVADVENKKSRMGRRLQDIMRWIIANNEFQYEVPTNTYNKLCKLLNPNYIKKEKSLVDPIKNVKVAPVNDVSNKSTDHYMYMMPFSPNEILPSPVSLYEPFEENEEGPRLMSLHDPSPDNLLAPIPASTTDPLVNLDLSRLIEIPPCSYDEIIDDPLTIEGKPKQPAVKTEAATVSDEEEKKILEDLNEIFFVEPEPPSTDESSQPKKVVKKIDEDETIAFFDTGKSLKHGIYAPEDSEFMDYLNYLPECSDPLYDQINHK